MDKVILGIDISKKHFDVALLVDNKYKNKNFTNDSTGFQSLKKWLTSNNIKKLHACLESTGCYGECLIEFLYQEEHLISVVNPSCIKFYARSKLSRHKTDRVDSKLIADYCNLYNPALWKPLPVDILQLRDLGRCINSLKLQLNQVVNQLESKVRESEFILNTRKDIKNIIEEKIKALSNEMDILLTKSSSLENDCNNLQTIPGIGKNTAILILAEIPDISTFKNARQLAAYAGLTPSQKFSGTSVKGKPRLSKIGAARLRKIMFFPAIVAKRFNPVIKNFCDNLEKKGKHNFAIVGAAMRKLLHIVFGVLKNKEVFNPNITDSF